MGTLVIRSWRRLWSLPLLALNGWVAFNLPRTVTAVGATLLLAIVVLHGYLLATQTALPVYFVVYAAVLAAGCLAAAAATARGRSGGWYVGSLVCLVFLGIYLISRFVALPGLEALTGRWDVAAGTFAMAFAAAFIGVHATVLSGINVAYPHRQHWQD